MNAEAMFATINTHEFIKSFVRLSQSKENSAEKTAELIINTISEAQQSYLDKILTKDDLKKELQLTEQRLKLFIFTSIVGLGGFIALIEKLIN